MWIYYNHKFYFLKWWLLYYMNCISKMRESTSLPLKGWWNKVNFSKCPYYRHLQYPGIFLLVNKQMLGELLSGYFPKCYLPSPWSFHWNHTTRNKVGVGIIHIKGIIGPKLKSRVIWLKAIASSNVYYFQDTFHIIFYKFLRNGK